MARRAATANRKASTRRWSMVETWFAILCLMLATYAVLDGWSAAWW